MDRQTYRHDWKHYLPAYAGGKYIGIQMDIDIDIKIEMAWKHNFMDILFMIIK